MRRPSHKNASRIQFFFFFVINFSPKQKPEKLSRLNPGDIEDEPLSKRRRDIRKIHRTVNLNFFIKIAWIIEISIEIYYRISIL